MSSTSAMLVTDDVVVAEAYSESNLYSESIVENSSLIYQRCKRLVDLLLAVIGLVLLAPLFAIVAAAIKLTSRGPVFFVQTRVGCNGKHFACYKFRSMVANAEALQKQLA